MWMSVLRVEHKGYKPGTMFAVTRVKDEVIAYYLDFAYSDGPRIDNSRAELRMGIGSAKAMFTKPTKDVSALMNESVNVSEAYYC
jgi:hypothetical protein